MSDDNLDIGHRPPGYISWTWSQTRETRTCRTFKGRYRPESEAGLRRHWNATREKAADRLKTIRAKQFNLRCEAVLSWTDYDTFNRRPVQVTGRCPNPKNGHPKFCVGHRHLVSPPPPWKRGKLRSKP